MYCQCGCGELTPIAKVTNRRWGHVAGQPVRFKLGHGMRAARRPEAERFWRHVAKGDDCWEWTGNRHPRRNVGVFRADARKNEYAPRTSYRLNVGPIPEGLYVCHHCDNPACVRPDHLFLGTQADNMRDMVEKGRHVSPFRQRTHCKHGHPLDEQNTQRTGPRGTYRRCRRCHALRAQAERARRAALSPEATARRLAHISSTKQRSGNSADGTLGRLGE